MSEGYFQVVGVAGSHVFDIYAGGQRVGCVCKCEYGWLPLGAFLLKTSRIDEYYVRIEDAVSAFIDRYTEIVSEFEAKKRYEGRKRAENGQEVQT